MEKCFVIQPFDNDKFDQRFKDTFAPAITKANLEPYRIDRDLSVRILIDDIEKHIIESPICFAEITTDNPNVWYELGFAFACGKDVVMVCSDERTGKFPFDIQHRQILKYKTSSKSDFETLEDTITNKIIAYQLNNKTVNRLSNTPVIDTEGLKSHEIALLILLMESQSTKETTTTISLLKNEMGKAGYTDIATSIGIRTLEKKTMIETAIEWGQDWENDQKYQFTVCSLTEKGVNWILDNQDQLVFRKTETTNITDPTNDLPF